MKISLLTTIVLFAACLAFAADSSPFELHPVANAPTSATKEYSLPPRNGQVQTVILDSTILLDHTALKSASIGREEDGTPNILIELTKAGGKQFGDITTKYIGKRLGIVLSGQLYSAPVVREAIWGGSLTITGNFTEAEAAELVKKLNQSVVK